MIVPGLPERGGQFACQGIPSVVQASLIPGLIGWGRARELLYFGDLITAKEAERIGFVNAVAAETDLDSLASKWSGRFGRVGHRAVRAQKQLMRVSDSFFSLWFPSRCWQSETWALTQSDHEGSLTCA